MPELLTRYHNAPPAARALIHAAMDARRLGMRPALPRAFLESAASGYLTGYEWDQLAEDWLQQALAYTAAPSKGIAGPLTRIRPRPTRSSVGSRDPSPIPDKEPAYRLADYLDQIGRGNRRDQIPPASFWTAAATSAHPGDLANLGYSAQLRGLCRDAAQLLKLAIASGDPYPAADLVDNLRRLHPADQRPASWTVAHLTVDDPQVAAWLLPPLRRVGAVEQIAKLFDRAAAYCSLDDPDAVAELLEALRQAGAREQVTTLLSRDPAVHAATNDPHAMSRLLDELLRADAQEQGIVLADRAVASVALDDPGRVATLLEVLRRHRAGRQITALLDRDPADHAAVDNVRAVAQLLGALRDAGAGEQVTSLAKRAALGVPLHAASDVAVLLDALRGAGAREQVTMLLGRDPAAQVDLNDAWDVAALLDALRGAGAREQVTRLLGRDPAARVPLHGSRIFTITRTVAVMLRALREAGAQKQVTTLADRAAAAVSLHNAIDVHVLLDELRETGQVNKLLNRDPVTLSDPTEIAVLLDALLEERGAGEQVTELADHAAAAAHLDDPRAVAGLLYMLRRAGGWAQAEVLADRAAADAPLDDPGAIAKLLGALSEIGTKAQVTTLLSRAPAARTSLDNSYYVYRLLEALQEADARQQASLLIDRLPGEGLFDIWLQEGHLERFRFGRGADGRPAEPWNWEDLD